MKMKKVFALILTLCIATAALSAFAAELPSGAAKVTSVASSGGYYTKLSGEKTGILRFVSKIEFNDGYDLEYFGMKFIPKTLRGTSSEEDSYIFVQSAADNYKSGETFSADLENIDEKFFSTDFLGIPYAKFKNYDTILYPETIESSSASLKDAKNLGIKQPLQCDINGDFKILIVADPHGDWADSAKNLETLVEKTDPDFVIIHGDIYMSAYGKMNVSGFSTLVEPLTKRGIPWATTNGNHDPYTDEDWATFKSIDGFLGEKVDPSDPNYVAERPVNFVLPVYANDGKTPVFNIWAMDSGRSTESGKYDGVTTTQIDWYKAKSAELRAKYGKDLTSLMCVHIPPTEMIDLYYSNSNGASSSVGIVGDKYQPIYGKIYGTFDGVTNYTTETGTLISKTAMNATHPSNNRGLVSALLDVNNIDIFIAGHDHANNFIGNYKGILMGFTGRITGETYSRGGRIVSFNQKNPENFTTEWISLYEGGENQPAIYQNATLAK